MQSGADVDVDVEVESLLPFPCEQVATYAGHPARAPEWYANIRSLPWLTPPVAVGSRMHFEARFLRMALAKDLARLAERLEQHKDAS